MKKRIRYTNEPVELEVIDDFLPPPDKLSLREEKIKVTITLSKTSVDFFKKHARKHRAPYQRMIRRVLDRYVNHYKST